MATAGSGKGMRDPDTLTIMGLLGLISRVFLLVMYAAMLLSRRACAFMMRSMLALQPYSPVTSTQGESTMRSLTSTFSTCAENGAMDCGVAMT